MHVQTVFIRVYVIFYSSSVGTRAPSNPNFHISTADAICQISRCTLLLPSWPFTAPSVFRVGSKSASRDPLLLARTKHVYYRDQHHRHRRSCGGGSRRRRASRWCVPRPRPRSAVCRFGAVALTSRRSSSSRPSDTGHRRASLRRARPILRLVSCAKTTGDYGVPANAAGTRGGDSSESADADNADRPADERRVHPRAP